MESSGCLWGAMLLGRREKHGRLDALPGAAALGTAFAALDQGKICGYCTLAARDCIPGITYTPFVGYVFVEEGYRGHRLSQRLIQAALQEAKRLGYPAVYLISDHEGLYEKYGFVPVDAAPAPWNPAKTETIFRYDLLQG